MNVDSKKNNARTFHNVSGDGLEHESLLIGSFELCYINQKSPSLQTFGEHTHPLDWLIEISTFAL